MDSMSHAAQTKSHVVETTDRSLGQRLILDLRYFCDDGTPASACRTPVTHLPESLKRLLVDYNIGGVILFSENIVSQSNVKDVHRGLQALLCHSASARTQDWQRLFCWRSPFAFHPLRAYSSCLLLLVFLPLRLFVV